MVIFIIAVIIVLIVLFVLWIEGVFTKPAACKHCGEIVKGTEQHVFCNIDNKDNSGRFILCNKCFRVLHYSAIQRYASDNWSYNDYLSYLDWRRNTMKERKKFKTTESYRFKNGQLVEIDVKHGLFKCSYFSHGDMPVLRFEDLGDYSLTIKEEDKDYGLKNKLITGKSLFSMDVKPFNLKIKNEIFNHKATISARKSKIFSKEYHYDYPHNFARMTNSFYLSKKILETGEEIDIIKVLNAIETLYDWGLITTITPEYLDQVEKNIHHTAEGMFDTSWAEKMYDACYTIRQVVK